MELTSLQPTNKYDVIDTKVYKKLWQIEKLFVPRVSMDYITESKEKIIYYDTSTNLLEKAGVILYKIIKDNECNVYISRDVSDNNSNFLTEYKEKVFKHPIGIKDSLMTHINFLIDGMNSMFYGGFNIDLENVFKNIIPKIEINVKKQTYKIYSISGFKGEIWIEDLKINNYFTRRKNRVPFVEITRTNKSITRDNEYGDFLKNIDRYFKELMPTKHSIYEMAKIYTREIPKLTKQEIIALKNKKKEAK